MPSAPAILVEYAAGRFAAIAFADMVEVLDGPEVLRVPFAPGHCEALTEWYGHRLPVFDLAAWNGTPPDGWQRFCVVVSYPHGGSRRYGALRAVSFPRIVEVDDVAAAPLPDASWRGFARSCFRHGERTVPVLALEQLFETSRAEADEAAPSTVEYNLA
ncbi:MAG TPA: chemotaxis protein CheW [Rhodocyclaceae bacterium]